MPEFQAIQCYQCCTFQVQQKKKAGKFICVVCGEKQSLRKVYTESTNAKEVRMVVQRLNLRRQQDMLQLENAECQDNQQDQMEPAERPSAPERSALPWDNFLEQAEEDGASVRSFDDVPNLEVTTAFEGPAFKKKSNIKRQTLSEANGVPRCVPGGLGHRSNIAAPLQCPLKLGAAATGENRPASQAQSQAKGRFAAADAQAALCPSKRKNFLNLAAHSQDKGLGLSKPTENLHNRQQERLANWPQNKTGIACRATEMTPGAQSHSKGAAVQTQQGHLDQKSGSKWGEFCNPQSALDKFCPVPAACNRWHSESEHASVNADSLVLAWDE